MPLSYCCCSSSAHARCRSRRAPSPLARTSSVIVKPLASGTSTGAGARRARAGGERRAAISARREHGERCVAMLTSPSRASAARRRHLRRSGGVGLRGCRLLRRRGFGRRGRVGRLPAAACRSLRCRGRRRAPAAPAPGTRSGRSTRGSRCWPRTSRSGRATARRAARGSCRSRRCRPRSAAARGSSRGPRSPSPRTGTPRPRASSSYSCELRGRQVARALRLRSATRLKSP